MSSAAKKHLDIQGVLSDFDEIKLTEKQFQKFSDYMYELAGVDLPFSMKNHALVRNRIVKLLRRHHLDNYEDYWSLLSKSPSKELISEFISALTTNMTSFYRESSHFDFLKDQLPSLLAKSSEIRIWCAAASTGQEPYTIAMTAKEVLAEKSGNAKILATDIDLQVLKRASVGNYEEREMQGLPVANRQKYFSRLNKDGDEFWRISDEINSMIRFAPFNLVTGSYEFKHKFNIIFCRNVLIYFDEETTKKVIQNLTNCLAPGGYLILGHSESGNVKNQGLKPLSRAVYQKI